MAFENIIGNEKVKVLLSNSINSNNVLHSYLFVGINGIGKSLFARELAQMILCLSNEIKPCGACKSCIEFQAESNPDFLQIEPEDGKNIKIDQIRYLQEKIAEKPVTSNRKVYIINNCDTMTREASNSLLKTLEEPPAYATIILITDNESKLLTTIKSRCTKVAFTPLDKNDIKTYIQKNRPDENINDNMIMQCQGSIGQLLKIVEDKDIFEQVENVVNKFDEDDITQIWNKAEVLYKEKEKIIDLLDYMNIIFYERLKEKNDTRCINAVYVIEEAKKRILANANYDMTIDNLLLKIWEEFS